MGVDSKIFGLEAGLFGIFISLQMWVFMLSLPPIHYLAKWVHERDDRMIDAVRKFSLESDAWDPWHHPDLVNKRPKGFGKGLPL